MEEPRQIIRATWLDRLVGQIRQGQGEVMRLPAQERRIAELALGGQDVHSIAQQVSVSERFVWDFLENLANTIGGAQSERPREIAGMGADLDAGVTGGYGDTGFGEIDTEPPVPVTEEAQKEVD